MRPADSGRDYHRYGLGYKYRQGNLPAAYTLVGLRRLDETNRWGIENWKMLDQMLAGTPNLVRSFSTDERPTNGYAYVLRADPGFAARCAAVVPSSSRFAGGRPGHSATAPYEITRMPLHFPPRKRKRKPKARAMMYTVTMIQAAISPWEKTPMSRTLGSTSPAQAMMAR